MSTNTDKMQNDCKGFRKQNGPTQLDLSKLLYKSYSLNLMRIITSEILKVF